MRAVQYAEEIDYNLCPFPLLALPKPDGIFGTVEAGALYTREGNRVNNEFIQDTFKSVAEFCMDMAIPLEFEIVVEGRDFNYSSGIARSKYGCDADVKLKVFDAYLPHLGYRFRHARASKVVAMLNRPDVVMLPYEVVTNRAECLAFKAKIAAYGIGYDGVVFRAPLGFYKKGPARSTQREAQLLRDKFVQTVGGEILYFCESIDKEGTPKSMCHSAVVRCYHQGAEVLTTVSMTNNLTDADRISFFTAPDKFVGRHIDFLTNGFDGMEYRHTRFDCWRQDKDDKN